MSRFKFNLLSNCIFCDEKLPDKANRTNNDGEHVFPKNIFGFWKSRDVCKKCIQYFGIEVDKLPLRNTEIIEAMKYLGLTEREYVEGQEFEGEDLYDKTKIDFVVDKKGPRIKSIKTKNFYQIPEDKVSTLGMEWIREISINTKTEEQLKTDLIELNEFVSKAKYGEIINYEKLGVSIRKTQAEITKAKSNSTSLRKLVAKIVIIFLNYLLPTNEILKIKEYQKIKGFALSKDDISDYTIYRSKLFDNDKYEKYHYIKIEDRDKFLNITVVFFGKISYSLPLIMSDKINIYSFNKNESLKGIKWYLDFDKERKIIILLKKQNDEVESFETIL